MPDKATHSAFRTWLIWTFLSHSCYSYARFQGVGLAHSMIPVLSQLPEEERRRALSEYVEPFNCEPNLAQVLVGAMARMEQAGGGTKARRLKSTASASLSGVGDSLTQAGVGPFALSVALMCALSGYVQSAFWYAVFMSLAVWCLGGFLFSFGYRHGVGAIRRVMNGSVQAVISAGSAAGALVVSGALASRYTEVSSFHPAVALSVLAFSYICLRRGLRPAQVAAVIFGASVIASSLLH
ncbi:MAG: PTS system mannose/fructose/sorbose family transporter subunit IID [Bacillota bacterium]